MTETDRVDRLHEVSRRTASDMETLASTLAGLRGRLESLEGQVESVATARTATAERVEQLAADLARVARIEQSVSAARTEMSAALDESERRVKAGLQVLADGRGMDAARWNRELEALATRLEALESLQARSNLTDRADLAQRDLTRLAQRLTDAEDRMTRLESAPPRTDPAVLSRFEAMNEQMLAVHRSLEEWQRKVEASAEVVRESRAVAEVMTEAVARVERAHHATAESQKLAEQRVDAALRALREEAATQWTRFHQARGHDWERLQADNTARDATAADLRRAIEAGGAGVDALRRDIAAELLSRERDHDELVHQIGEALRILTEAMASARQALETNLPFDERSDVTTERRNAERRAFRARRDAR